MRKTMINWLIRIIKNVLKIKSPTEKCNQFCKNCEIHLRKYLEESKDQ